MHHSLRRGLGSLAGLAALALVGLTAREAHAEWYCGVVDGPDSTYPGATSSPVFDVGNAIVWNGALYPFYAVSIPDAGTVVRWGTMPVNGGWSLATLSGTGTNSDNLTGLVVDDVLVTAFADSYQHLYIGASATVPTGGPARVAGSGIRQNAMVFYNGEIWVFYDFGPDPAFTSIEYIVWNGVAWSSPATLTTTGETPAPVVFDDNLYVFYYDIPGHLARSAWNGSSWTQALIDGYGTGGTSDSVGQNPSVIVDTNQSPNVLHVFYFDDTVGSLRAATQTVAGTWSFAVVDGGGLARMGGYSAPVLQSGTTQVYYTDDTNGFIRGATLVNGSWTYLATIDGPSEPSGLCAQQGGGGTFDTLGGPIAVASFGGGPNLFYLDTDSGDLRTAYWY